MAILTPDLSEAVEFSGVVPGIYNARISNAEVKTSKAGNTYVKWELTIFGAEGELSRFNNHKVWHSTNTSGKAAGMLKSFYKAAAGKDLAGSLDTDELLSKEILVTLAEGKNEDGSPSQYPQVKGVKPITVPF